MKIRFNHVISVIVAIVFVVTSANAKNSPQNPMARNQSIPAKHSVRRSSNKTHFPVSHIVAPDHKSSSAINAKIILVTSTKSTSTVRSTSVNTIATTNIKLFAPANNNKETLLVKGTANNATAKTSIEGTAAAQAVKISNVEKVTSNQMDENRISIKKQNHKNRKLLIKPVSRQCREGYIITSTGDCKPIFQDE
ncbi:uncharacterized protein LOC132948223 [Metopolophium dirhodum]|uniref:uncharacterized protein LOC132948223 n=1 Tax=Metopolophium dirhodum TaxID=44670 RepID=UPI0029900E6B|nr:uncharacterized protein LOC132948223 [Metopolophium dirhodum]